VSLSSLSFLARDKTFRTHNPGWAWALPHHILEGVCNSAAMGALTPPSLSRALHSPCVTLVSTTSWAVTPPQLVGEIHRGGGVC
jgi:hypothetical protein